MLNKSVYYFMSVAKVYYSFRLWWKLLIVMISSPQFCLYSLTYLLCIVLGKWLIAKDMQHIRPSVLSWKVQIFTFLFQSTLLLSWQLLNSFKLNSTNFLLLLPTADFAFHVQKRPLWWDDPSLPKIQALHLHQTILYQGHNFMFELRQFF